MFFAPTVDQVNMYDNEGSTKNRFAFDFLVRNVSKPWQNYLPSRTFASK